MMITFEARDPTHVLTGLAPSRQPDRALVAVGLPYACDNELRIGAEENRTLDLLHAMQALSQLSYGPGASVKLARLPAVVNERPRDKRGEVRYFSRKCDADTAGCEDWRASRRVPMY